MVHAVLMIYACRCSNQCCQDATHLIGYTGHGKAWQNVIAELRRAGTDLLKRDFGYDDGERHLAIEIVGRMSSRGQTLTKEQVRKWSMKVETFVGITRHRIQRQWGLPLEATVHYFEKYQNMAEG
jgi:hypothetical protein